MSLCINPHCQKAQKQTNQGQNLFCDSCGSSLLIEDIYRVVRKLGEGGFGTTYLVDDAGAKYVLKVLHNTAPKAVELFQQEAEILKKLNHSGIPKVEPTSPFVYITSSSQPLHCLIMEYIEGENLYRYLERRNFQPISEKAALRWLRQLVEILHLVHGANYFHRDIKPHNIMIRNNGQLALIDFGTAREETSTYFQKQKGKRITGIVSSGYTPYEQQQGQAEPRSDFFALSRTFVFLLTGKEPGEFIDSLNKGLKWQDFAQGYAKALRDFLDLLMRPDVEHRPDNTTVILEQIQQLEQQLQPQLSPAPNSLTPPQSTPKPTPVPRQPLTLQARNFAGIFGGFLVGVLVKVWDSVLLAFQKALDAIKNIPWKVCAWRLTFFCIAGYLMSVWDESAIIFLSSMFFLNAHISLDPLRKNKKIKPFIFVVLSYLPNFLVNYLVLGLWLAFFSYIFNEYFPLILSNTVVWIIVLGMFCLSLLFGAFSIVIYSPVIKQLSLKYSNNSRHNFYNFILRMVTVSLGIGLGWVIHQQFPVIEESVPLFPSFKEILEGHWDILEWIYKKII